MSHSINIKFPLNKESENGGCGHFYETEYEIWADFGLVGKWQYALKKF